MFITIVLILLTGIVYFWFDSLKTRETAEQAARRVCANIQVQFLDHSVSLKHIKPVRQTSGRLTLKRLYEFEFSADGANRQQGRVLMIGNNPVSLQADHDQGTTIEQESDET